MPKPVTGPVYMGMHIYNDCLVKLDHAQNYLRDVAYEVGLSSSLEQMEQEKPAAQL